MRHVVVLGDPAPDATAPRLAGAGTNADPFVVDALPFAAHGDTRTMGESAIAAYSCAPEDESGPELRFRFHLDAPTHVTATVASGTGADLDVHLLPAGNDGSGCIARDDHTVAAALPAGDWDLVVDTFAGPSGPSPGEAFVVLLAQ